MYCQKTYELLKKTNNHYESTEVKYPVVNDICFMGYNKDDEEVILEILNDSQNHQGIIESFEGSFEYSKFSYPLILKLINFIKTLKIERSHNAVAVNVGGGGDPSTNELAALGFQTYLLDIEPNTLFIQKIWDKYLYNKNIYRICCDSFYLPFPNNSVDIIFCKEFLHHIKNYDRMLNEFNRVLKKNGLAIIVEPTLTWRTPSDTISEPYHHYQKVDKYLFSFKANNLAIKRHYLYHLIKREKLKNLLISPVYEYFNNQFEKGSYTINFINSNLQKLIDGENIWCLNKTKDCSKYFNRINKIQLINPIYLTLNEEVYNHPILLKGVDFYLKLRKSLLKND